VEKPWGGGAGRTACRPDETLGSPTRRRQQVLVKEPHTGEATAAMVTSTVDVHLRERQVLFVAPDNEGTRRWGVYGCPDMYRAEDDSIVVYDDGHMDTYDSEAAKCPAVCFRSGDNGLTWASLASELREGDGLPGKAFRLADGGRVQFLPKGSVNLAALGVAPRGMAFTANEYGLIGLFRLGDLPPEARSFTVRYQSRGTDEWRSDDAVFDMPDVQIAATLKAKSGGSSGRRWRRDCRRPRWVPEVSCWNGTASSRRPTPDISTSPTCMACSQGIASIPNGRRSCSRPPGVPWSHACRT